MRSWPSAPPSHLVSILILKSNLGFNRRVLLGRLANPLQRGAVVLALHTNHFTTLTFPAPFLLQTPACLPARCPTPQPTTDQHRGAIALVHIYGKER
jgi:hypothetical protein